MFHCAAVFFKLRLIVVCLLLNPVSDVSSESVGLVVNNVSGYWLVVCVARTSRSIDP